MLKWFSVEKKKQQWTFRIFESRFAQFKIKNDASLMFFRGMVIMKKVRWNTEYFRKIRISAFDNAINIEFRLKFVWKYFFSYYLFLSSLINFDHISILSSSDHIEQFLSLSLSISFTSLYFNCANRSFLFFSHWKQLPYCNLVAVSLFNSVMA